MKKSKTLTRWGIALALGAAISGGVAYADSTHWIFCTSFESPGVSCSAGGGGPVTSEPGADGNLWDQMSWNRGSWQ